ncbi:MAG TPA: hypothetical protein VN885_01235 [Candidatus Acidoferrales bacterium]|nr:hypothetical protein [Candidatus Acidoferrales bacterium]
MAQIGPFGQEDEQPTKDENGSGEKAKGWPPIRDVFWSNWALVIVGIVAAIIAICTLQNIARQTTATEQAVAAANKSAAAADATFTTMKDTAQTELRAYVLPLKGWVKKDLYYKDRLAIRIVVKNSGNTPASKCKMCLAVGIDDFPAPANLPTVEADLGKSRFDLAPGGETELGGMLKDAGSLDLLGVKQNTKGIYAFGEIRYWDVFGTERFSKFRMVCTGEWISEGRFWFCEDGNEAN